MGNEEWVTHRTHQNNKIQSHPLTRGGLGWGQTVVDTVIMTYQTSSYGVGRLPPFSPQI